MAGPDPDWVTTREAPGGSTPSQQVRIGIVEAYTDSVVIGGGYNALEFVSHSPGTDHPNVGESPLTLDESGTPRFLVSGLYRVRIWGDLGKPGVSVPDVATWNPQLDLTWPDGLSYDPVLIGRDFGFLPSSREFSFSQERMVWLGGDLGPGQRGSVPDQVLRRRERGRSDAAPRDPPRDEDGRRRGGLLGVDD